MFDLTMRNGYKVSCKGWNDFLLKLRNRNQSIATIEYVFPYAIQAIIPGDSGDTYAVDLTAEGLSYYVAGVGLEDGILTLVLSESDPGKDKALSDRQLLARIEMLSGDFQKVQACVNDLDIESGSTVPYEISEMKGLSIKKAEAPDGRDLTPSGKWKATEVEADRWDYSDDQPETPVLDLRFDD